MSNQNPVDDLDFSPQKPSPTAPKKGVSRRAMKSIATLMLVLAGGLAGYAINSMMRTTTGGGTVSATKWSSLSQAATVYEGVPDSNYLQEYAYPQQEFYSLWGYMTFPLASRPTGFSSAVVNLLCRGYNFTWVNVTLITANWNSTTITWNTRPVQGAQVACIPVENTLSIYKNVTFDVTTFVDSGANLSICLTVLYNNTRAQFAGGVNEGFIKWSHDIPVSTDASPYIIIIFAAVFAVIAMILLTRKHGGN